MNLEKMTGLEYDLRAEQEMLFRMMPIWRRHEAITRRDFLATGESSDFIEYVDAYSKLRAASEMLEFINTILRNNIGNE